MSEGSVDLWLMTFFQKLCLWISMSSRVFVNVCRLLLWQCDSFDSLLLCNRRRGRRTINQREVTQRLPTRDRYFLRLGLLWMLAYFSKICSSTGFRSICRIVHHPLHCCQHSVYGAGSSWHEQRDWALPENRKLCKHFILLLCTQIIKDSRIYDIRSKTI